MIEVTDSTFEQEVLKSTIPVVVDFWAPWCGPCKAMSAGFDEVSAEQEGKVKFVKVNVDECTDLPLTYKVRGIPTLVTFSNGNQLKSTSGFKTKAQLTDIAAELVGD